LLPGPPFLDAPETLSLLLFDLVHHVFALPLAARNFVVIGVHVDVLAHMTSVFDTRQ
jgi:hypothetical protein